MSDAGDAEEVLVDTVGGDTTGPGLASIIFTKRQCLPGIKSPIFSHASTTSCIPIAIGVIGNEEKQHKNRTSLKNGTLIATLQMKSCSEMRVWTLNWVLAALNEF